MHAIIPAAGRGTRMAAVTGGRPKELLTLGGRTILERVVQEAEEIGCARIVIVNAPGKPEIDAFVLERYGQPNPRVEVRYQKSMRGLADAVASACLAEDAVVLLGDTVMAPRSPARRLADALRQGAFAAVATETVPDDEVSRYGIVEAESGAVRRILEKPDPGETTSRQAVASRFALSGRALTELAEFVRDWHAAREVTLSDFLSQAIGRGEPVAAVPLGGDENRVDCGTPEEYASAKELPWWS
ncbi:MAG: sugar phosphate nucleotidyltransferase [Fimbriimonadaceae bacterium]